MIPLSSKLGLLSLGVWAALVGCGKTSDNDANVADSSAGAGTAGTAGEQNGPIQLGTGGLGNVDLAGNVAGVGGMPMPPETGCGEAGGESAGAAGANEECAPPPSVCADGQRLAYYSSGVCVAGTCRWTIEMLQCPDSCEHGACVTSITAK